MAELQRVSSHNSLCSSKRDGSESLYEVPFSSDIGGATYTLQASVAHAVAPALQDGAAASASQVVAASKQRVISPAHAEEVCGSARSRAGGVTGSGSDVCAGGHRCREVVSDEINGLYGGGTKNPLQQQPVTSGRAVAESSPECTDTRFITAVAAEGPACSARLEKCDSSLTSTTENLSGGSRTFSGTPAEVVERVYSVQGEHMQKSANRVDITLGNVIVQEYAKKQSTAGIERVVVGAESACDGSTSSDAADCCGCVGPTLETSAPDAAGVPPYLRIESLPALLDEGSGGPVCVLLGQKKEALLYSVATPFGANKCVLVCIYMLYAFLTGCVYFGWPSVSYMLLTSGAYSWRCPKDDNGEYIVDLRKPQNTNESFTGDNNSSTREDDGGGKYYICDEQDAAVSPLFTIAYVTQSLMSVVAGTVLDHVSPKYAAMLGQTLNAVGWILLACSSYTFQAYIPAMVFIGLGADTAYLPTLLIAALFPGKRGTVITLLGSANTASFAVPMLLEMLWKAKPEWTFSQICWLYVGVGPFFCCCLAALFIPRSSFVSAALRKLPMHQQQQSPLHSGTEDALLRAEERETQDYDVSPRTRRSVCCCCFGVSDEEQQKRMCSHAPQQYVGNNEVHSCTCWHSEVEHVASATKERGRRQRLRHFFMNAFRGCSSRVSSVFKQLQRTIEARFCSKTNAGHGCHAQAVSQPQQSPPQDLEGQQLQLSSDCGWRAGVNRRSRSDEKTRGRAASGDLSTVVTLTAVETSSPEAVAAAAPVAAGTLASADVADAKLDISTPRCVKTKGACLPIYGDIEGKSDSATVHHAQHDAIKPYEKRCCCHEAYEKDGCCRQLPSGEGPSYICACCSQQRSRAVSTAVRVQQSGSGDEELGEMATTSIRCKKYTHAPPAAEAGKTSDEDGIQVSATLHALASGEPQNRCSPTTAAAEREEEEEEDEEEPSFCSQLLSPHFMCIVLYWSGMAVASSYFQSTSSRLFSRKALDFMDVALSFSFVPCVLLGKMIDRFGPFPALFVVNTMGVLAYCFALAGRAERNLLQYGSIVAYCVYVSVDSEQVFCYVENTFSAKHFGKLSGLALTTGGVLSLVSIPLYEEITLRILQKNPWPVCCGLMIVLVLLYFTLGSMWLVRLKNPPAFKAERKRLKTPAAAALVTETNSAVALVAAADPSDGKERKAAYAANGDGANAAAGTLCCLPRRHSQSSCCGKNGADTLSRIVNRTGSDDVWSQRESLDANTESDTASQRHSAAVRCGLTLLGNLFHGNRGSSRPTEVMHQPGGADGQQEP